MNEESKKPNRKRDIFIRFMVDEKERDMIYKRMEQTGIKNLRAYLLKQAIDGEVVHIELDSVKEVISCEVCRRTRFTVLWRSLHLRHICNGYRFLERGALQNNRENCALCITAMHNIVEIKNMILTTVIRLC
jgi:hypothetical protein